MPQLCLSVAGKCVKSEKYLKDVNKEDYDRCYQDYPNCGETVLERSNKMTERYIQAKKAKAGRRRSKTKKGAMRRKRMTKRR